MDFEFTVNEDGKPVVKVALSDYALISNPLLNKGMAFSMREREEFNLFGLIPPYESTLSLQCHRSYQAFKSKNTPIEQYIYLRDLQDSNETLFYKLLGDHITELMPIVYTPTVGVGCQRFSHIYRRPRGVFISYLDKDRIDKILANPRFDHVQAIVVSDGERILGLGDQGAGGMGIPIGKLALYTACAGIHPVSTLPILLDTGTDNEELLHDPLYIGWHHERIRGQAYNDFIEVFIQAIKKRFSHVLLQWEDFAQQNAYPLLEHYRDQLCTFNDDIQGTASVAAGTLIAAIRTAKASLKDQRIVVVGAGSAGCGISRLLLQVMIEEGLSAEEARHHFYLVDRSGLVLDEMPNLLSFQKPFAQSKSALTNWQLENPNQISLSDTVKNVRPTVLIGVSGQPGIFTESLIREMAMHVEHPIIFPLSNPTERCEATPQDLMHWTQGNAIIGTGSPFAETIKNGKKFRVDQTNNAYIFPGIGLGLTSVRSKRITDTMFMIAAKTLADCSPAKFDPNANLLPPLTEIHEVSFRVALAVAREAITEGLADFPLSADLETKIRQRMWVPEYLPYCNKSKP
jgi:malate dehydrogenase (oxaloacetate-decarboxylating)